MNYLSKRIIQIFLLASFFVLPLQAQAARMYFQADSAQLSSTGLFEIDIFVDTQGEVVNAFEGSIVLPPELLNVVDIRDGASYISLWIQRPKHLGEGEVHYSGIIPGGISGSDIFLFSVIGEVKDTSTRSLTATPNYGQIKFKDIQVLLHDGKGSPASTSEEVFPFTVTTAVSIPDAEKAEALRIDDREPPEIFEPILTKDKNLYDGNYSLIFSTQDKGTGVSHYELLSTKKPIADNNVDFIEEGWEQIESPLLLDDQTLSKNLYVKAVDKVGNQRIVLIPAENPLGPYQKPLIWVIISVSTILLLFMGLLLRRSNRELNKTKN